MAIDLQDIEIRRSVVAANVRARMAWLDMSRPELAKKAGITRRTLFDRLEGTRPFKDDQLWKIAAALGLETPAPLFEIPPGFPPPVRSRAQGLLPCTFYAFPLVRGYGRGYRAGGRDGVGRSSPRVALVVERKVA
jgi:DNA-binding XRE family transcriptional regulator